MAHQMAQEGALWPSIMITLGRKVKLHWANIANDSSTIGCWQLDININVIHTYMVQLKLYWLSYSLN